MKCPIINSKFVNIQDCLKNECALWTGTCAVTSIARSLEYILKNIETLIEPEHSTAMHIDGASGTGMRVSKPVREQWCPKCQALNSKVMGFPYSRCDKCGHVYDITLIEPVRKDFCPNCHSADSTVEGDINSTCHECGFVYNGVKHE